jgi:hypothetical protein
MALMCQLDFNNSQLRLPAKYDNLMKISLFCCEAYLGYIQSIALGTQLQRNRDAQR